MFEKKALDVGPVSAFTRDGIDFGTCPICGGILPIMTLVNDTKTLVQPEPIPTGGASQVVNINGSPIATSARAMLQARGRLETRFVPHAFMCPGLLQMGLTPPLFRWVVPPQPCAKCGHFHALHEKNGGCKICECDGFAKMVEPAEGSGA